jgi:hypothetical protein
MPVQSYRKVGLLSTYLVSSTPSLPLNRALWPRNGLPDDCCSSGVPKDAETQGVPRNGFRAAKGPFKIKRRNRRPPTYEACPKVFGTGRALNRAKPSAKRAPGTAFASPDDAQVGMTSGEAWYAKAPEVAGLKFG